MGQKPPIVNRTDSKGYLYGNFMKHHLRLPPQVLSQPPVHMQQQLCSRAIHKRRGKKDKFDPYRDAAAVNPARLAWGGIP